VCRRADRLRASTAATAGTFDPSNLRSLIMKTIVHVVVMASLCAAVGACSGLPVILTPGGQAQMAKENVAVCANHADTLKQPIPAQTRANIIKDMQNRHCPNTPAE
jgi:hypothetical protein